MGVDSRLWDHTQDRLSGILGSVDVLDKGIGWTMSQTVFRKRKCID